ncbi:hypothetical protein FHS87_004715 [Roseomonas pecuniae]|uniref:Uncharacterized protein n=1 Tax=Muricoccus pecuniae TaxID=693023 RepID=A0A840YJ62_9PROT|nr:hypothetical protein [Roseomonas pecuniae]
MRQYGNHPDCRAADPDPRLLELTSVVHQLLPGRADVEVALVVVGKVGAAERAVLAGRLVEHRDVRLNVLLVHKPIAHGRRAVAGVGHQALGPQTERLCRAGQYGLRSAHHGLAHGRGGLHVHDDGVFHIDEELSQ